MEDQFELPEAVEKLTRRAGALEAIVIMARIQIEAILKVYGETLHKNVRESLGETLTTLKWEEAECKPS